MKTLKNLRYFLGLIAMMLVCIMAFSGYRVSAAEHTFEAQYVTISVPDDYYVITGDTSKYDEIWIEAGITDASDKLKEFTSMGIVAMFIDPDTGVEVNFISKSNSQTASVFNLLGRSEDDIKAYAESLIEGSEGLEVRTDVYQHDQTPFFRLYITMESEGQSAAETIYGTIMNGQALQFDVFNDDGVARGEEMLREIVDSVTFTRILTYEEYSELTKASTIRFFAIVGGVILVTAALVTLGVVKSKRLKKKAAAIASSMQDFRIRRHDGLVVTGAPRFEVETVYNDALIDTFIPFNVWIRDILRLILWLVLLLLFVVGVWSSNGFAYALIFMIVIVVLIYVMYNRGEKHKEALKKQYETAKKHTATCRFYDEYFTMSGIGSMSEYIYKQVTDVREYKGLILVYISADHAIILDSQGVKNGKASDLTAWIKEHKA